MRHLALILLLLASTIASAQSIGASAGYLIADRDLKNVAGNGPSVGVTFFFAKDYAESIQAGITFSFFQSGQMSLTQGLSSPLRVRIPELSWFMYLPAVTGHDFFVGAGGGVGLSFFSAVRPVPNLGSRADYSFTQSGGFVGALGIYRGITLDVSYRLRSVEGLTGTFRFGGWHLAAGYQVHL